MHISRQAWWAPVAAALVVAELLVAQAFLIGDGTSNILNAESTTAGAALAIGGAIALVAGLWARPKIAGLGNALIVAGAALALVVIVGVVISAARSTASPAAPVSDPESVVGHGVDR